MAAEELHSPKRVPPADIKHLPTFWPLRNLQNPSWLPAYFQKKKFFFER
jgi:hypothetical protein